MTDEIAKNAEGMTAEAGTADAASPAKAPEKDKVDWIAEVRGLALMLLAVLVFHSLVAKPFYIPSISMMPNLLVGDRLVVSKYPYGWNWSSASFHLAPRGDWRVMGAAPEYGEIVIVVPRNRTDDLIKRVVALPGDRIALKRGVIWLNGKPIRRDMEAPLRIPLDPELNCDERGVQVWCYGGISAPRERLPDGREFLLPRTWRETMPNGATYLTFDNEDEGMDDFDEVPVPAGHVFLMGDNRDHSADSRYPLAADGLGGPVPLSDIGGRAEFTTFSLNGTQGWNPLTWWGALRSNRSWSSLRPALAHPGK